MVDTILNSKRITPLNFNRERFGEIIVEIKEIYERTHQYIVDSKLDLWVNSIIQYPRYCVLTSNTTELFNVRIVEKTR